MIIRLIFGLCLAFNAVYADEVIWKGKVESDGTPSQVVHLQLRDQYQIRVSQYINLGKWVQAQEKLANDACYQFSEKLPPSKQESIQNSSNIPVCDGKYHSDHIYESEPFIAKQNRIFFWIQDTDYDDNSGFFEVEIIHKTK